MKRLLIASVVLLSMVFAEFGGYVGIVGGEYGFLYSPNSNIDLQFSAGSSDLETSVGSVTTKINVNFIQAKGTYYMLTNQNLSFGPMVSLTQAKGTVFDEDNVDVSEIALGASAKWKVSDIISLKADFVAFSSSNWEIGNEKFKQTSLLATNEAKIYVMFDLF